MKRVAPPGFRSSAPPGSASLVCLCLLLPFNAFAGHSATRLAELVKEGHFQAAYEYALKHRARHEGELEYDLYYGIAAIQVGELSEGIFALERVITLEPGFDRARLELARAYFLREDDRRARREFETVLAHDPPPAVAAQIERYLAAIDRRADRYQTTASGYVEFSLGHDSNVNAATASEGVDTIIGRVTLADSSRELDDDFARVEARGSISHPIAPGVNLVGGAGLWNRSLSSESEFETGALDARLGIMWRDEMSRLVISSQLERFYLDGDEFRDLLGLGAQYYRTLSAVLSFDVSGRVSKLDYEDRPELDSTLWLLDAGISRSLGGPRQPVVSAGAFLGTEDADDNTAAAQAGTERDIVGVRAALWLSLAPRWTLRGRFEYSFSEFAEENVLFAETLEEDYYFVGAAIDWRPAARWRIGPEVGYTRNDANIELFEYDRTEFWVRARYEFY